MNRHDPENGAHDSGSRQATLGERVRSLRLGQTSSGGGSQGGHVLPWVICGMLFLTTLVFGYRTYRLGPSVSDEPTPADRGEAGTMAPMSTTSASTGDIVLQSKGYIVPLHQVQVSPKVSGMLIWLDPRLEEGARFNQGDVLARLEDVEYRADRDRAAATVKNLKAQMAKLQQMPRPEEVPPSMAKVREMEANAVDQRDQFLRAERLYAQRVINEEELVRRRQAANMADQQLATRQAEYALLQAGAWTPDVKAAEALVAQAQADLDKAIWRLENTNIVAPLSGTILTKKAERGNLVNPSAFSNGLSASLCDMADLSDIEVDLQIQEREVAKVVKGQPCAVMPDAFANYEPFRKKHPDGYTGVVSRLMPIADRAKGAIPVRVRVDVPKDEEGVYLKPDMGVTVSFLKADKK